MDPNENRREAFRIRTLLGSEPGPLPATGPMLVALHYGGLDAALDRLRELDAAYREWLAAGGFPASMEALTGG